MGNKGFLKRMLPFFATFAIGLFIASFFVSINLLLIVYHELLSNVSTEFLK